MAVLRKNILTNPSDRDAYIDGILKLKQENTAVLTSAFGIPGPPVFVKTYDLFIIWHHQAMTTPVPPGGNPQIRNGAHRGPVFLPWHRVMLAFLEINIQRVLGKPDFGIPYWDWSFEGSTPPALQSLSLMFTDPNAFGSDGNPVTSGRFAFNAADPNSFRVLIETDLSGSLRQVVRGLRRQFRSGASTLPSVLDVNAAFDTVADPNLAVYDQAPWDRTSTGFRNRLEGFIGTGLHNQVHRWVGGDMEPPSSPNDPLFYVHHCNVDRIWEGWMQRNGRVYLPDMNESPNLLGHRIDDPIVSPFLTTPSTPRSTLDVSNIYVYDVLP